ncbi:MAG: cohesin domain-containing protein, partial [Candidatus Falkowbacteria bacterium]
FLFVFFSANAVNAASLYLSPSTGSYEVGKTFSVSVFVSSSDQAMNAADGVISFPTDIIEVSSLSKSGTIFNLWVQEPGFSNSAGTVNYEGVVMNPGFTGAGGKIITINFKAKAEGQATLIFSSGSVLANDGEGTNILSSLGGAKFNITLPAPKEPVAEKEVIISAPGINTPAAPIVTSLTHPDQEKWYSNNNPEFNFTLPKGITGVNVLADKNSNTDPGIRSDGLFSSYTYEDVDDGSWYFHVRLRNGYGWGGIIHYRFQIDTEPPAPFAIQFIDGRETDKPQIRIYFNTTDNLSGIDYYTIDYGGNDSPKITAVEMVDKNSYTLAPLPVGRRQINVIAFDKAGNSTIATDEFTVKPVIAPEITDYPRKLAAGETLTVIGKTIYVNSDIAIWLQKDKDESQKYSSLSDGAGKFIFNQPEIIEGVYRLWAVVVDKDGNQSNPSAKVTIVVKESFFKGLGAKLYQIGTWMISILTILIPILALLFLLLLLLWYIWQKFKKLRAKAAKEIREAKKALRKELAKSKKDIQKHIEILEGNMARRKLINETEGKIIEKLKKDLEDKEKITRKEIKDIEKPQDDYSERF